MVTRSVHGRPLPREPHVCCDDMLAEAAVQLAPGAVAHQTLDAQNHDIKQRPTGLRANHPSVLVRLSYLVWGLDYMPAGLLHGSQLPCAL